MKRRQFAMSVATLPLAGGAFASAARAQGDDWPVRSVRVVCPFTPGGSQDNIARRLSSRLSEYLGQSFMVENRTGAGGSIAADNVAKSPPDGYSILLGNIGSHALVPHLYARPSYNAFTDLETVVWIGTQPNLLCCKPGFPYDTIPKLIEIGRKEPGKYSFASSGPGTSLHLSGELFKTMANVDIVHVPYKGAGPAYNDLIAGTVQMMFANMPSMLPQVRGGKIKGLGVTSAKRFAGAPDIPAIGETLPGYVATSWYGVGAPAATPEPILARLEAAIVEALKQPDLQKRWADDLGLELPPSGRAGFAEFLAEDRKLWAPAVKASGVKLD